MIDLWKVFGFSWCHMERHVGRHVRLLKKSTLFSCGQSETSTPQLVIQNRIPWHKLDSYLKAPKCMYDIIQSKYLILETLQKSLVGLSHYRRKPGATPNGGIPTQNGHETERKRKPHTAL